MIFSMNMVNKTGPRIEFSVTSIGTEVAFGDHRWSSTRGIVTKQGVYNGQSHMEINCDCMKNGCH